ncbi:hypothetical protein A3F02_02725 [Candidatus Curtissbacteria bacterium RIFCSPHIGHO2_12_FULL_38_9b]|uniref:Uncharacterized protein n=2 Tax=Candidatus Curtissiibacteriota TaxID=1752717 RepID=A0A1F5GUD8_9BACT|nr:MAG: hypothetical protein A3A48_03180 [Candidatus Curtissbacteria bacterium RIFCSPLOWO2_01_FULL_37_9]OGD95492.1 MAG: hypothetical protein A3F02_02725 [Candidatus Curtissbacteria bacterium RIFCSPHIGHO2_12_FULL_38_9b]
MTKRLPTGFATPIILVIIGLIIGIGITFAYFQFKSKPEPQPQSATSQSTSQSSPTSKVSPTASPNETANWKIYTNTAFGFSIQYPDSLVKKPTEYQGEGGTIVVDVWSPPDNSYTITSYSYPDIYAQSAKPEFNAKTESNTTVQVAGQSVKRLAGKEFISDKGTLIQVGTIVNKPQNHMLIYSSGSQTASSDSIATFDKIVATFKLTK